MMSQFGRNSWEDFYSRKAKKDNYPARSVYKLQEIQQKYRIIQKGDRVLDLGCAPGSWLLYAAELTGSKGKVVGVDIKPVEIRMPPHVKSIIGNVLDLNAPWVSEIGDNFSVVMSDMAPSTTGAGNSDVAKSLELCEAAFSIAMKLLVTGGSFVCKIFQGEGFKQFSDRVKASFQHHRIFKPKSSRKASREIYIIGIRKKSI